MDAESLINSTTKAKPRKVRFAPKALPKKEKKPILPKIEKTENDIDDDQAEQLLRKLKESSLKARPKFERKAEPTQVAFGYGASSTSLKSYGAAKKKINSNPGSSSNGIGEHRAEKEYKEPWDYYSNYPVTLPLRRPYSGNPELLDKEEFEAEPETTYDENQNPAEELGLMEENLEKQLVLLQLPKTLPILNQSANGEVQDKDNNSNVAKGSGKSQKPVTLESLPEGFMGKLLVYKSGAVKLKLGDTLYDVSAGLDCMFAQDVVAVNTKEGHCCNLGELNKRGIVSPDIDNILDRMSDL